MRKRVLSLAEQVCETSHDAKYRRAYGKACINCAHSWERQKNGEGKRIALELKEKALSIRKQLREENNSVGDRKSLAYAYSELGYTYADMEEKEKALAMQEKALMLWRELAEENNTIQIKRNLVNTYSDIGDIYQGELFVLVSYEEMDQGISISSKERKFRKRQDTALEWYQKALSLQEEIVKEQPTALNRTSLYYRYYDLAELYSQFYGRDARDKVLEFYNQSIELLSNWDAGKKSVKKKYLTPIFFCVTLPEVMRDGRKNRTGVSLRFLWRTFK